MPTPAFPAGTLDDAGFPAWITGLAMEEPNHTVHVVRDLAPADAMQVVGARPGMITSCQLPGQRPDGNTSLPGAAIGPTDSGSVLLAGQIGAWTFVYDDMGLTFAGEDPERANGFAPPAKMLSADGREAATSTFTVEGDTNLAYASDGDLLFFVVENVDPAGSDIPAKLRPAVQAAGTFESGDEEDDYPDEGINMRVLCALAGLTITLDELRKIPLLVAPFS
jgi:hypothetical protein